MNTTIGEVVANERVVPLVGQDMQSHLMGTHTFVRAQEYHQLSGIRQATFRVVLRQEIVVAFRTQTPVQLLREYVQVDRSMDRTDDWTLAFHIIVLCAEILTYCYGNSSKTAEVWDDLAGKAQAWMNSKSASFKPIYRVPSRMSETQVFPQIWLLNDCHGRSGFIRGKQARELSCLSSIAVAAYTHYLIGQILLVAHDPRRPQLGPGRAEAVEAANVSSFNNQRVPLSDNICSVCDSGSCERYMRDRFVKLPLHTCHVYS